METQLAILCQSVAVDRFTNRLSLFNIIERIEAPQFPVFLSESTFVILLRRETSEVNAFDGEITIHLRAGTETTPVGVARLRVDFENGTATRQIANFQGLPLMSPGILEFRMALPDGQTSGAQIPVEVGPGGYR